MKRASVVSSSMKPQQNMRVAYPGPGDSAKVGVLVTGWHIR